MAQLHSSYSIRCLLADTDVFNKYTVKFILGKDLVKERSSKALITPSNRRHLEGTNSSPICEGITYRAAIAMAIRSSPGKCLPLRAIYRWIEGNYPHFSRNNENWKDTVRYNLSHNKIFVRVPRPANDPGRGNYWTIDTIAEDVQTRNQIRKRMLKNKIQLYHPYERTECPSGAAYPDACAAAVKQFEKCPPKPVQQEYSYQAWNIFTHWQYQ
ncbi:PREDICTED: fork head domain transcription factor slp1-like [Rhagoletis zephyria]|uniref:fork head domain transcription factor slp1-like n=1 Tax=Rhagoletis zephyria TaxID=28612 RepID=UPI0008114A92|nr:PREDICTED: fork head domain transcription factor slp1-like [Rhagoletis zephyria]